MEKWIDELTEEQLFDLLVPDAQAAIQARLEQILRMSYFQPLTNEEEIISILRTRAVGRPFETDEAARSRFIDGAKSWGDFANVAPVFHLVRPGYYAEFHGPLHGPCRNWSTADAQLRDNPPTPRALTFFLPSPRPLFLFETVQRQLALCEECNREFGLEPYLIRGLGSFTMLTGHVLAHFVETDQKLLAGDWVRTDTFHRDGARLLLGDFDALGLHCYDSDYYGGKRDYFGRGCFPLGVQELDP